MDDLEINLKIEGILFYKGTPFKKQELCKLLEINEETLSNNLEIISNRLKSGAIRLLETDKEVQLVTIPQLDNLIEGMRKDELKRDIGKAGAETLAIILYRGPISRSDIDSIRGVNSSFIIRNLLTRGLIEKQSQGNSNLFSVTPILLAHLGITNIQDLPDRPDILDKLEAFEKEIENENK